MKVIFLGTGTSHGVPMIACDCAVCRSPDLKNKRLRSSVLIENSRGHNLLIDASPDFRQQALRYKINDIQAILITHLHADHIFGLDEMRRYTQKYDKHIPVYLKREFNPKIKRIFPYIYKRPFQIGGGVARLKNKIASPGREFVLNGFNITPLEINHGLLPILGYRIDDFAYLTDCSEIPPAAFRYLKGLKVLALSALREKKHATHFSLAEAVEAARKIGASKTYFTHIAHNLEHKAVNRRLTKDMQLAYDGLTVHC